MDEFIIEETKFYKLKDYKPDFFLVFENTNKRIQVHRAILLTSPYFENILKPREGFPQFSPSDELILKNEREDIIHIIIAYLYGCTISFEKLNIEQKLFLLETADLYLLPKLVESIRKCVEFNLSYDNILKFTDAAIKFDLNNLYDICLQFIANNIKELMSSDLFVEKLTKEQLIYIFQELGDHLYINEIDVQESIKNWTNHHEEVSEDEYKDIYLSCLRLELFNAEEFNNCETLSEIFTNAEHGNSILVNNPKRRRKIREPDIDFSKLTGVQIDGGDNTNRLKTTLDIDLERQTQYTYVKHLEENPIIIDLGNIHLTNYIDLHLYERKEEESFTNYSYSYFVETSVEKNGGYFRVINHSFHICRSKQRIFFCPREVRYIKIVGMGSYINLELDANQQYMFIKSFSCQLIDETFDISRGFWSPIERITDHNLDCHLAIGSNNPEGNTAWMLKPNCLETNYSYHKMGKKHKKKALMVHLPQPVYINRISLRLLENEYGYEIMGSDSDPNINSFLHIERDKNNYFNALLMQFIMVKGLSQNCDLFKCTDLICP